MANKITVSHDEIRHLIDIIHYDDHPDRVESTEFRHNKEEFHALIQAGKIPACFINNGYCEGHTEIHHYLVEYSAGTEVEWVNVNGVLRLIDKTSPDLTNPDQRPNLIQLCHKHHMGVGTGIHMISFPAWIMQKFLNEKNIALFEAAVAHIKEQMHPNNEDPAHDDHRIVNAKAQAILKKLTAA